MARSKFHDSCQRCGQVNEHNARVSRGHWLDDEEKRALVDFHAQYPLEGYRRLVLQRARERCLEARPQISSDNGPRFVAKEFKEFARQCEMTHERTSPY
jgi:hypothetical protein